MALPIWHNLTIKECLKALKVTPKGLDEKEVERRQRKYGLNKLPEAKRLSRLAIFLEQFKNPLVYILLIAATICFFLEEFIDMSVILAAVVLNTIVGFIQEDKAERAIWSLRKMVKKKARVLRNGGEHEIEAEELVPGDIIFLEAGDNIPADARLIEVRDMEVVEAALTGESIPSQKTTEPQDKGAPLGDRENMVYMGTVIEKGKGKATVVATGKETEIGRIALMVKETKEDKTPLQKKMEALSRVISIILGIVCVAIFLVGILTGRDFVEMLLITVALAVAAIPEGLPAAVTIVLALGMQEIFKRKGLIRKLVATETLGSTTVICTDKTGTLTEGKMAVSHIITQEELRKFNYKNALGVTKDGSRNILLTLKIGLLCNNAVIENPYEELREWIILGEPTEKALLMAAVQAGLDKNVLEKEFPRIDEISFDAEKKYMATLHKNTRTQEHRNTRIIYMKGAPEKILEMSKFLEGARGRKELSPNQIKGIQVKYESLTSKGLRVLAVAYKETEKPKNKETKEQLVEENIKDLVFVGLVGLKDPLRPEAKETIKLCRQAGLRPVIVTGDHRLTAQAVAQEVGFTTEEENILEGKELDKMSDEDLKKVAGKIDIYARVEPKHKLRIIDALQAKGEVVAMTGDGVNDAPALKSADIGVALGSGTDVAKGASDIVILDDNFRTIVQSIERGRVAFENIKKVTLYLLADSFSEIILVGGTILMGFPLPILPAQILWINLIEDGLPNIALAFEAGEKEVMKDPPQKITEPILDKEMKVLIFIIGLITDLVLFVVFWWLWKTGYELAYIRTMIFVMLGLDSLFYVFSCRSLRFTIFHKNPFSNKFLSISVLIGVAFLAGGVYLPFCQTILRTVFLSLEDWFLPITLSIFKIVLIEITKYIFIVRKKMVRLAHKTS